VAIRASVWSCVEDYPVAEPTIHYEIRAPRPQAHLFAVRCTVSAPDPAGQGFALPAWIPGSYMIREFAKHVVAIRATHRGRAVALAKTDKHTWRAAPVNGPLAIEMEVFAHDTSVRGAFLDTTRGFFNGSCVFLRVLGQEARPCSVFIAAPALTAARRWVLATSMRPTRVDARGFGAYAAPDYDELIDHPVEMGALTQVTYRACRVPHVVAITGRHDADLRRLSNDLKKLCEYQIRLFGEPAPMHRYVFLVNAVSEGYGGLEHRASTALICGRDELPRVGMRAPTEGYRTFLGLASHEYFHTWNVKRIKPAAFTPYDLDREGYTKLLWAFEGITSYYDDLTLVRTGLISRQDYLTTLARNVTSLLRNPGRRAQTVEESSWDAWIKYYRQDENTPNAVVSYYLKGSLVALCLDLEIRARTNHRKSLDDVMRALWRRFGKTARGVGEGEIERVAESVSGLKLRSSFGTMLRSTAELPLARSLKTVGVEMTVRPARSPSDRGAAANKASPSAPAAVVSIGVRTINEGNDVRVTHVLEGSAARDAGVAPGDVIVALDGLRLTGKNFDATVGRLRPGQRVVVHAFRRDELIEVPLVARRAQADTCELVWPQGRHPLLDRWLGRPS
jgi:predicted metalloprotease with PDZ domain